MLRGSSKPIDKKFKKVHITLWIILLSLSCVVIILLFLSCIPSLNNLCKVGALAIGWVLIGGVFLYALIIAIASFLYALGSFDK